MRYYRHSRPKRTIETRVAIVGLVVLPIILTLGCEGPSVDPISWAQEGDSTLVLAIEEDPETCRDCIVLEEAAVMGDTLGPGYLTGGAVDAVRDSLGNYWVGERGTVKVFGPTGRFLREVGRAGQGPLEFESARPIHVDADGNTHIFDSRQRRETVVGPDFELVMERRLPGSIRDAIPLDATRYVAAMWLPTPDYIGLPLHVIDGSEILHSFGVVRSEASGPMTSFTSERIIAMDRSGHVFSARYYEYFIEAWTTDGNRIAAFEGPTLNEHEVLPGAASPENPVPSRIWALHVDASGLLWVASFIIRENWRDGVNETLTRDGQIGFVMRGSPGGIWEGRIDVIDLNTASIIATSRQDQLIISFLGDGLGLESRLLPNGTPQLAVWNITLQR